MANKNAIRLTLPRTILFSGLMHALLIGVTLFSAFPGRATTFYRPQYQVRLVRPDEIPSLRPSQSEGKPQHPAPPEPAKVEKKVVVVPEEKKGEKPKPAQQAKAKEKTPPQQKPSKEPKGEDRIEEAIKRIEGDIKYRNLLASKESSGLKGLTGMGGSLEYNEYYDEIEQRVRQNWIPPEQYDPSMQDLVTVVSLSILPDGNIEKSWVEKSSGDRFFDESVMRAILKSNPLPPPPINIATSSLEVGLRFHSNPDYETNKTP